ncbi:MAG: mucoidy inhibitor MuiA family protein [Deltaproteobacteria bacterium]|nr:mucoidy inhibitor MuiA family protein [Deltaproteobacteria bacterium]
MKRLFISAICVLLVTSLAFAEETVPSRIKEVTLFSGQALIQREAFATIDKGVHELFLEVEAFRIDRDSVSAKVFGSGEIFSVQFKEIHVKESPRENIKILEQKIEKLKQTRRTLTDEKDVLNKKDLFLRSLITFSQTQVPQDVKTSFPKIEDLEKTLTFLASQLQAINTRKQHLDSKIDDIDKEIKVLERELGSLHEPEKKTKKFIAVLFKSLREQKIKIEATYVTRRAQWAPLYRVSVPLTLREVDLAMFSKIQQKTGEHWKNVALTISNVIPLQGVELPSPDTWTLDIQRQRARRLKSFGRDAMEKAAPAMSVQETKEEADFEQVPEEEATVAYAQREELPLSFEYKIPQMLDIESRNKETILPLFGRKLQGEFFYYAVPGKSLLTFLVCQARADKELLSGPLNVYFGDRFIGKTFLSEKKPGQDFNLNLGADREVKVKREKIKDNVKETFFGQLERDTIIREMAFKITLENLKDKPVKLKVMDTLPVSRTDKVKVKDITINPAPAEKNYQDREGVLLWECQLKPEEKKEITIEFVVTYPKNLPVQGL